MIPIPTLDELATHPDRVKGLPALVVAALLAQTSSVLAALSGRMADCAEASLPEPGPDALIDVHEAARRLGTSPRTLWRKKAEPPYAAMVRSNGTRRLRFSAAAVADHVTLGPGRRSSSPPTGARARGGRPASLGPHSTRRG